MIDTTGLPDGLRGRVVRFIDALDIDTSGMATVVRQQSGMTVLARYLRSEDVILVGSPTDAAGDEYRFAHEVGHAWDGTYYTDADRAWFLDLWGRDDWFRGADRADRGTETHASFFGWWFASDRVRALPWPLGSYGLDPATFEAAAARIRSFEPITPPQEDPVAQIADVTTANTRPGHRHNIRVSYRQAGRDPLSTAEAEGVRYWIDETETHADPAFVVNFCRMLLDLPPTV